MTKIVLVADDYEYALPDHWVAHALTPDLPFMKLHEYYARRVVEIVKESGAKNVLEAGCGDGWITAQLAQAGLDAVGIDWSSRAIAHAKTMAPSGRFHCGDVRDQAFLESFPQKFDAVVLVEVIEHIPPADTVEALQNVISRLREDGTFVLTTPHVNFPNNNPQHYRHFTPELLGDILEKVGGISVLSIEGYGDVVADRAYWRKRRFVDNRLFTIKPIADRWERSVRFSGPTPLDRCHGIILVGRKKLELASSSNAQIMS